MVTSGVATRKGVDLDFEDDSQTAVHVIVHNLKPPFLDGRTVFTKQLDPVNPIRDPTSDMAVFAKKGSALVKEKREQAERAKAAAKLAALGGTALGNILGVKDEEADAEGVSILFVLELDTHKAVDGTGIHLQWRPRQKQRKVQWRITKVTPSLRVI
jgi:pre-mRNA-splicing factor ATP-dependent RNA helicase DHX38/PRP16